MAFAAINSSATKKIPAIEDGFAAEPSLKKRVYDAIGTTPQYIPLFEDIAKYTSNLLVRNASTPVQPVATPTDGPTAKKRKLQNGDAAGQAQSPGDLKANAPLQFYMQDVSFAVPQRKKLTLEITAGRGFLRARNQTSKAVEFGIHVDRIQHVLCLPVPEKNQKQFNFCIIPQYSDGINPPPEGETAPEAMVWTVNDGPPKAAFSGNGQQIGTNDGETAENIVRQMLNENVLHTKVVRPDEREFVSAMPEAHRKGEKAYHVKAFRGSKEGYLFFLSTGVLFGFKKPLVFFAFENIDSISYTSVLQRTFNLNIVARPTSSDETQELEFSMIDQADFAGIDAYIKKHSLQDASLAEARRAKRYNINGAKTGEEGAMDTDGPVEEESELQKAQRELDDEEDEDEEDYDPGSDDSNDGSGSSSEEDSDEDEEDEEEGRDLLADELGSEAGDVPAEQL
ncbi:putative negative regulator of DNA transposition [Aspergillus bombycis]|uniref:Putative negative regulator of DNA transposition n=1 Tax=Aspergillus bombycis TaxID=109264 RepID=A0A1F7ZQR2_9EURO|nr:putative negative regulator of DNA transposition [Aspergillus bombycis]OGM41800.1 putative negative regulator of DNA transposition [Aspergillus bombycis]